VLGIVNVVLTQCHGGNKVGQVRGQPCEYAGADLDYSSFSFLAQHKYMGFTLLWMIERTKVTIVPLRSLKCRGKLENAVCGKPILKMSL
jgi:hypothetical protein